MGSEAMRRWGVGQKGKDNGAILFVFVGDRKMRIEVGYGLEGSLTDAKAKWISSTVIKPEFQRSDFNAGINKGVDAMLATVRGETYRGGGRTVAEVASAEGRIAILVILTILLIVAAAAQVYVGFQFGLRYARPLPSPDTQAFVEQISRTTFLRRVTIGLLPTICFVAVLVFEELTIGAFPIVLACVIPLFAMFCGVLAAATAIDAKFRPTGGAAPGGASFPTDSESSSSSWSSSSTSSSSSSFSGGGGSGGGGGASDSW
jgi:uncharacterized protein